MTARRFVVALRRTARALATLGEAAQVGIVPDRFDELEAIAAAEEASFSVSGAGGGDVAAYVGPAAPSAKFLERAHALGLFPLDALADNKGVRDGASDTSIVSHRRSAAIRWPMTNMNTRTSSLPGFYKVTVEERRNLVSEATGVSADTIATALDAGGLSAETADKFVENVLGIYGLPYGVTLNVRVNGKDHVAPMVVEEPSVVAAASNAAKMVRIGGGFQVEVDAPIMIGQVQLIQVEGSRGCDGSDPGDEGRDPLAAQTQPFQASRCGGGARGLEVRELGVAADEMIVVHILVDCRDAMGANLINTVAEAVADRLGGARERQGRPSDFPVQSLRQALRARALHAFPRSVLATG